MSATTLALALTTAATPMARAEAATPQAVIDWQPCAEDAGAECGTLQAPLDWSKPHGERIGIAVARRRATDPSARIGSLLFHPGGPGISGRNRVLFQPGRFSDELRRRFDIVGFDPRGVGLSHPVLCPSALLALEPSIILTGQSDLDHWLDYNRRLRAECRRLTGPIYDHVDTVSVVRDLDLLRAALGESKLTFYGVSGGTLIAQHYAERFPRKVRAIVADSILDHSVDTRAYLESSALAMQDSFDEFVKWNDRTNGNDIRAVWRDVLDSTARGEIPHPEEPQRALRPYELVFFAQSIFYGPAWQVLALVLDAWHAGEPYPLPVEPPQPPPAVVPYPIPAIFCADFSLPIKDFGGYAQHLRRSARIAPDTLYSPVALYVTLACLGTRQPIPNPQHRLSLDGLATPMLVVNARHDPASAYAWATETVRQAGDNAVLVTYDGWGHEVYGRSPCADAIVDAYLTTLTVPAAGTRCPAVGG